MWPERPDLNLHAGCFGFTASVASANAYHPSERQLLPLAVASPNQLRQPRRSTYDPEAAPCSGNNVSPSRDGMGLATSASAGGSTAPHCTRTQCLQADLRHAVGPFLNRRSAPELRLHAPQAGIAVPLDLWHNHLTTASTLSSSQGGGQALSFPHHTCRPQKPCSGSSNVFARPRPASLPSYPRCPLAPGHGSLVNAQDCTYRYAICAGSPISAWIRQPHGKIIHLHNDFQHSWPGRVMRR